ncbi:MAG: carbon-nitrogen hydrolase family protein [Ignavibacteriales bacterium]|nr:carbon-nitrogen hydrolase family protein [Ignavibacteriales bacterium]
MSAIIRIGSAQLPTIIEGRSFGEKQKVNLAQILIMLEQAGKRKSDLLLFGEYVNLHHRTWSSNKKEYIPDPIPGPFTDTIAAAAKEWGLNVALPVFGIYKGVLSSHVVLLNRKGTIVGCYQKAHPTLPEQEMGIKAGTDLPVFTLDCARIGIMTCMDIEYPEVAQVLMLRGAEVLLFPHVQSTWGEIDWEIRYRARAIDTGLPLVSACYGYREGEWLPGKMIGRTSVVGRDGLILADLGRAIDLLTYDLDLDDKRITPFFFDKKYDRTLAVIASRRPELYGDIANEAIKEKALKTIKAMETKGRKRQEVVSMKSKV